MHVSILSLALLAFAPAAVLSLQSSKHQMRHRALAAHYNSLSSDNTTSSAHALEKRQRTGLCPAPYRNAVTITGPGTLPPITRSSPMVTRSGTNLYLNGAPFRPVGPNVYWLAADENVGPPGITDRGRVREAMAMAVAMGANVVRGQSLGISVGHSYSIWPSPNSPNEAAFEAVDYAIAAAATYGLRLVIPLVDQVHLLNGPINLSYCIQYNYYLGGKYTFLGWTGASQANNGYAFFTDRPTINLYKAYISDVLNRVNKYTGNEMGGYQLNQGVPPAAWTNEIASFIHANAKQLVVDGSDGLFNAQGTPIPGLGVSSVDIVTDHAYPPDVSVLNKDITLARNAGKNLYFGEYDWKVSNLQQWLSAIEQQGNIGDSFWSLFGHDAQCCQFVRHNDGYSLYYYDQTQSAALKANILLVVQHFYRMTGRQPPSSPPAVACPQPEFLRVGLMPAPQRNGLMPASD